MKNYLILIVLLFGFNILNAQNNAQKIFESHLKTVEDYLDLVEKHIREKDSSRVSMDGPIKSAQFLEEITKIKCDTDQAYDEIPDPSKKNFRNWKKWYRKNKQNIYWDENSKSVKTKS